MSDLYIPRGKLLKADRITADTLIVKGALEVSGNVYARRVVGDGFIKAANISAKTVTAFSIEVHCLDVERVAASRIVAQEVYASRSVVCTMFFKAPFVSTPKLTVSHRLTFNEDVGRIVYLPKRGGGLLRTVFTSQFRTFTAALRGWWTQRKRLNGLNVVAGGYMDGERIKWTDAGKAA